MIQRLSPAAQRRLEDLANGCTPNSQGRTELEGRCFENVSSQTLTQAGVEHYWLTRSGTTVSQPVEPATQFVHPTPVGYLDDQERVELAVIADLRKVLANRQYISYFLAALAFIGWIL